MNSLVWACSCCTGCSGLMCNTTTNTSASVHIFFLSLESFFKLLFAQFQAPSSHWDTFDRCTCERLNGPEPNGPHIVWYNKSESGKQRATSQLSNRQHLCHICIRLVCQQCLWTGSSAVSQSPFSLAVPTPEINQVHFLKWVVLYQNVTPYPKIHHRTIHETPPDQRGNGLSRSSPRGANVLVRTIYY